MMKKSKRSDPHRLFFKFTDKINLRRKDKHIALSNLCIYNTWKNIKKPYRKSRFKIWPRHGMKKFIYLIDHILCPIFKIILHTY